ncbi:DMT family transporter [Microvirga mediterraneensis]|uniref:DMT family transporter n=1 Tax=Microvirga mediterraneensis TaxID=2754695 RepID=A0A838BRI0_9HYPH|nr:DMT family transporter [Microvirga mediterraneensis]MBA1157582.1 DMT family transporter [Microvirga mediterraneensis]
MMPPTDVKDRHVANRQGAAFAFADMVLVVIAMGVIKQAGATFPAIQLVFFRAVVGLLLIAPLIWRYRSDVLNSRQMKGHIGRVLCSSMALSCNYAATAALPLTLVTVIGFTRPFVILGFAAVLLGERILRRHWITSVICFVSVLFIVKPGSMSWDWGLLAALGMVLFGSSSVIQTRRLTREPAVALMVFYTIGLAVLTAVPAAFVWVSPALSDLPTFLIIGALAQVGQFCFLRSHQLAEASILAPLSYVVIVFSSIADYLYFGIVPTLSLVVGSLVIVMAAFTGTQIGGLRR